MFNAPDTALFKYCIVSFIYVYQIITSLGRTGILFQNNLYIFKLTQKHTIEGYENQLKYI